MPAPENTNQLSNVTLFLQNLRKKPKNVILGWHDGGKKPQTIIPKAFKSICGMGVEVQPLWVKGFRSHFNSLADIRAVR